MTPLRAEIEALCLSRLGRLPDLENPAGYNDKIHWLKLHDQRVLHGICCDKWAVRDYVAERAGPECLIPAKLGLENIEYPCIAKATHDSGSAVVLRSAADLPAAAAKLKKRLARPYGKGKGEWAYDMVQPRIIVERLITDDAVDYKFHCVDGEVKWVQIIWNRRTGNPHEAIVLPDRTMTALQMDEKMVHCPEPKIVPGEAAWAELTALAQNLSADWRYVRVDLYWQHRQPWFGEMTFWPRAGCYRCADEAKFGAMLDIDLSYKLEPVVT
jgi:hypothetical protein